jgi:two-component sensor histidine kinase
MLAIVRRTAQTVSDQATGRALADVTIRLRTAAVTYQALRPPQVGHVCELDQELKTLCESISNSILSSRGIALTLASDSVSICAYRYWQISLVIFELVTNAARHAFGLEKDGSIKVIARVCDGNLQCAVIDDGVCEGVASPGRGTTIVNALITDLGGTISRNHSKAGSMIAVCVPLDDPTVLSRLAVASSTAPLQNSFFSFLERRDSTSERE